MRIPARRRATACLGAFLAAAAAFAAAGFAVPEEGKAPPGNSAFTGTLFLSDVAINRKGTDGDVWRLAE